jgi:sigma-B regulation protein RsbU (phosphoserine phosphatase)
MTIKWKITLSLVFVSLFLIASYVYTAQKIFQDDKISYIYENQQLKIDDLISDFNKAIDDAISQARFYVKEYGASGQVAPETMTLFRNQTGLDGIYIYRLENHNLDTVAKKDGIAPLDFNKYVSRLNLKKLEVVHMDESTFLVSLPMQASSPANLALVVKFNPAADTASSMQYFFAEGNTVVRNFGAQYIKDSDAVPLFEKAKTDQENVSSATSRVHIGSDNYLTTAAATKFGNLRFISLIDEKEALKALDELLNKSILYLIISILLTFIVSLLLSHRLTFRMRKLTLVAEEIGKGDFDAPIDFESKDEVGVLAQAFKKMGQEIKQLFSQKIEKDRMERELQTAAIIQERLFPAEGTKRFNDFLLSGYYDTSTECGGDWWHYYQSGYDLIFMIADTTGHGIPAALITSASNAIFSHIKRENYDLEKIIQLWDEAVYQSSKGEFFMTAQFVRLNLTTGDGELINLGHELPILYKSENATAKFMVVPKNFSIGERSQSPPEVYKFSLDHGDQLLMYSDGVLAMMSDDSNEFSDKQFLKKISSFFAKDTYGEGTAEEIFTFLREQSKRTLPGFEDDVTLVRISRGS